MGRVRTGVLDLTDYARFSIRLRRSNCGWLASLRMAQALRRRLNDRPCQQRPFPARRYIGVAGLVIDTTIFIPQSFNLIEASFCEYGARIAFGDRNAKQVFSEVGHRDPKLLVGTRCPSFNGPPTQRNLPYRVHQTAVVRTPVLRVSADQ